jgi:hypothetical protein
MEFKDLNDKQKDLYLHLSSKKLLKFTLSQEERIMFEITDLQKKLKIVRKQKAEDNKEFKKYLNEYLYPLYPLPDLS